MSEMSPHVSNVFKELFEELKSTKRQQWTMTNYCVLILAAIYTVNLPNYSVLLKSVAVITDRRITPLTANAVAYCAITHPLG